MRRATIAPIAVAVALAAAAVAGAAPAERTVELASDGPLAGGADSDHVRVEPRLSDDGALAAFATGEPLAASDTDADADVYAHVGGTTQLMSGGPRAGDADSADALLSAIADDGRRVFFETDEPLVPGDADTDRDVYLSDGDSVHLVSGGPRAGGGDSRPASLAGPAAGGAAILRTSEQLVAGDADGDPDLYRATPAGGGVFDLALVSGGPNDGGTDSAGVERAGVSDDGRSVFFATAESLTGDDGDADRDLYRHRDGITTLISGGPRNGGADSDSLGFTLSGDISADGLSKGFTSVEQLAPGDDDNTQDVYRGAGGQPRLVSGGTEHGVHRAARHTAGLDFVETVDALVPGDTDTDSDVYGIGSGTVTLITDGPLAGGPDSVRVGFGVYPSADGARVGFRTAERLVPEDRDDHTDLYERSAGVTRLVSGGPLAGGDDSSDVFTVEHAGGDRLLFATEEPLHPDDTDADRDFYEHLAGEVRLVTGGPLAGGDDSMPINDLQVAREGDVALFRTFEPLVEADRDVHMDAYLSMPVADAPAPPGDPAPTPVPTPTPTPPPPGPPFPFPSPDSVAPDATAPAVRALRVRPARLRLGRRPPRAARRGAIRLRLSEPARVRLSFERSRPGRRVGGRCRPRPSAGRGRRCRRWVSVRGAVKLRLGAGTSRIRFEGRVDRRRRLRPGRYRLTVRATDAAGNRSRPRRARFRLRPAGRPVPRSLAR